MPSQSAEEARYPSKEASKEDSWILKDKEFDEELLWDECLLGSSSASSLSSHSGTSNFMYEQESWDVYRGRVEKLCDTLWPSPNSIGHRCSKSLQRSKLFRTLVRSTQAPLIERLKGGSYNRITGITLPSSYGQESQELILRTPREENEEARPDRDVALLDDVRQRTTIPVPAIAASDSKDQNPLKSPYVLQHRISGSSLNMLWNEQRS